MYRKPPERLTISEDVMWANTARLFQFGVIPNITGIKNTGTAKSPVITGKAVT